MDRNVTALFCTLALLIVGCDGDPIDADKLVERDGMTYEINSEVGFTGRAIGTHKNGQRAVEATFKDGKPVGKWVEWHKNGQEKLQVNYNQNGMIEGKRIEWDENGTRMGRKWAGNQLR